MPSRKARCSPLGQVVLGDCLDRVSAIARDAAPRFDLVYLDPPFNAGGVRRARSGVGERSNGARAYRDHWGGIEAFLAMLEPRLRAVRQVMTERASLWLHLDQRAVHEAKLLLDQVFGRQRYLGEVIWVPGNGGRRRNGPSMTHQTILIYGKGESMIWNADDPMLREPYAGTSLRMHFKEVDEAGRRFRTRVLGGKAYRYYADQGRRFGSVWTECPAMNANTPLTEETTGYPTQKPERLLERIVRAASHLDSWVLDPMCGSGTTVAVAERLGRRSIGIDQSPVATRIATERLIASANKRATTVIDPEPMTRPRRGAKTHTC